MRQTIGWNRQTGGDNSSCILTHMINNIFDLERIVSLLKIILRELYFQLIKCEKILYRKKYDNFA